MPFIPNYTPDGGHKADCLFSGQVVPTLTGCRNGAVAVGSDVMFYSGAGRLQAVIPHQTLMALSGVTGVFYDAHAPVSGGPIPASGHVILGNSLNQNRITNSGDQLAAGVPLVLNVPFYSGLCYNSRSGQAGVTVVWTPESHQRGG